MSAPRPGWRWVILLEPQLQAARACCRFLRWTHQHMMTTQDGCADEKQRLAGQWMQFTYVLTYLGQHRVAGRPTLMGGVPATGRKLAVLAPATADSRRIVQLLQTMRLLAPGMMCLKTHRQGRPASGHPQVLDPLRIYTPGGDPSGAGMRPMVPLQ